MKRTILSITTFAAIGFLGACGSSSSEDVDSAITPDSPDNPTGCDPLAQTGCEAGQRCTWVTVFADDPDTPVNEFVGTNACVEQGTSGLGDACAEGEPGAATGFDNCVAGAYCLGGVCTGICDFDTNQGCENGDICGGYVDVFEDESTLGLCQASCDPLAQNCENASEACYLRRVDGAATCAGDFSDAVEMIDCDGPVSGNCYLNGCDIGHGALLGIYSWDMDGDMTFETPEFEVGMTIQGDPDRSFCSLFCSPPNIDDAGADFTAGCAFGSDINAPSPVPAGFTYECRYYNSLYPDFSTTGDSLFPNVTDAIGTCVPVSDTTGGCLSANAFVPPAEDAPTIDFVSAYHRDRGCLALNGNAGDERMWWVNSPGRAARLQRLIDSNVVKINKAAVETIRQTLAQ